MTPAFPSVTFPNHYTLVTGLYPESHGIVGNEFFDPHLNANFSYRDPKRSWDSKWWGGEPIWVTSVLQNKSSAVLMWPGCSSAIRNTTPTYHVDYNDNMTQVAKMDKLLEWIDLPLERRPQLLAAYIPEVDKNGHKAGPESDLVNLALEEVDGMIKHLLIGLAARNLTEIVNIVIVSDHGMTSTSNSRLIYYDDILTPDAFSHVGTTEGWPLLLIRSTDANTTDTIYKQLRDHTLAVPSNFTVYLREDVPQRFHFSATDRIPQIVAIPDVGYVFVTHNQFNDSEPYTPRGIHGYDNLAEDMRALFVARGPAFDGVVGGGKVVRAFDNVEVYGILAKVLGLTPALNNGTWDGSLQMV
ncbi:alkaline-phosphatase-like protein [Jimgerdemannia flammicorona]|uniref:Alkaline-phosphatase-like protein n=1 Tax=Jimgerdemannia flammicorona TaxID=994334 RepID=A0A433B985_9FUNG|nr:alkaline-phosphatase-like protein [Jimgerdemannia flammicorona]